MRKATLGVLIAGATIVASYAQSHIAGPVSGMVFDGASRSLRPILGIPGASMLGDAIDIGSGVLAAYVAPRQDSALVVTAGGSRFVRLSGTAAVALDAMGLIAAPERVAFSPSGTAAALYAAGEVQLISGLPDAPTVMPSIRIGASQSGAARPIRVAAPSFAVSDDGRYILAASGASIRLFGTGGENVGVMDAGIGALVAFAPGSRDGAVWDSAAGLVLLSDLPANGPRRVLAAPEMVFGPHAGLAFSSDGSKLYLASPRAVTAFDPGTGKSSDIGCECQPAGLLPMGRLFRLNEAGAGPLWVLDPGSDTPRIVFVPARQELNAVR